MYTITPLRVAALLLLYAALFVVIRTHKKRIAPEERRTFVLIASIWASSVFVANYLLFLAGVMSFLPWINNFLHTFVWIGGCLSVLYLGIRHSEPMWAQFIIFATFSLIVKYAEQALFGTWELGHFFHLFEGNIAYVLGWSLADGLYPPLTYYGLRLVSKRVPGLATQ